MVKCKSPRYFLEDNKNTLMVNICLSVNGLSFSFRRYVKEEEVLKTEIVSISNLNNKDVFINLVRKDSLFKEAYTFIQNNDGSVYCFPLSIYNINKYMKKGSFNPSLDLKEIKSKFKMVLGTLEKCKKEEYFDITGKEYGVEKPSEDDLMLLEINGYAL